MIFLQVYGEADRAGLISHYINRTVKAQLGKPLVSSRASSQSDHLPLLMRIQTSNSGMSPVGSWWQDLQQTRVGSGAYGLLGIEWFDESR